MFKMTKPDYLTKTTAGNAALSATVLNTPLKRILKRFSGLSLAQATPPSETRLKQLF